MESKQNEKGIAQAVFSPQTMGIFVLLLIVLSFIAGAVRQELALTLSGAVFLALWGYCLLMTLLIALMYRRRVRRVSIQVSPREIAAGEESQIVYTENNWTSGKPNAAVQVTHNETAGRIRPFFQMPGVLIRCRLLLSTKDMRRIQRDFNPQPMRGGKPVPPFARRTEPFDVPFRGAYFSAYDEFAVFDALGFFRFAWRIPHASGVRLLASPAAADEPLPLNAHAGESNRLPDFSFQRTDTLIDHRPYVPGDDPRRINWKLYGHGGELFVREGEREPPPHSNIIILIDTEYDPLLYTACAARQGIDLLCENALAAALASAESGADALIGYTGGNGTGAGYLHGNSPAELATALAWPAALPMPAGSDLPAAPEDRGILILALPRASAQPTALDRFLRDFANRVCEKKQSQAAELVFLYTSDSASGGDSVFNERAAAAETCAVICNRRPNVRARAIGIHKGSSPRQTNAQR
jgi:hypothetical protein